MKYFSCLILFCISYLSFPQQQKIDSLTIELERHKNPTIDRLEIINLLAYHYHLSDPEIGLIQSNEAITLAKALNLKSEEAVAYKNKARNLNALSRDSLAILTYDKAEKIQTELKNWDEVARITYNKGLLYFGQSKYEESDKCNYKAYEIFEREKDSFLMAVVLNSIGISQMYSSLYPEAIDAYLKASSIYEKINKANSSRHAEVLTNIGILYARLKKYDLALEYYNKSLNINKALNLDYAVANLQINIGNLYDSIEQPEKAITYYESALDIMKLTKNQYGIASAHSNIGISYNNLHDYENALVELRHAQTLFEELNNSHSLSIVHESIGQALLENPKRTSKQLIEAKSNFEKALNFAKISNSINREASALEQLAIVNSILNDYKTAYFNQKVAEKLKDSFLSTNKKEEIVRKEEYYKYKKKAANLNAIHLKEQTNKEAEIAQQKFIKNTSIVGGSSLICASLIGFMLYRRKQEANAKAKEASFNLKVSDTELKALRAQMNPHFIFNSLNSINDYIAKNDTENATNYLTKFSKLMRETLEKSTQKEITINEDINILKTYMDIENKRSNHNFKYTINIDNAIDPENTLIPPMILQPFVENSIIHGLSSIKTDGHITISFEKHSDMLVCYVEDNGIGRAQSSKLTTKSDKRSLGMSITKSRIDILNKQKNTKGDVTIIDKTNGTKIEVKLPLTLAF